MASREEAQRICAQSGCIVIVLPCDLEAIVALCRLKGRGRNADAELSARTGCFVAGTKEQLADARQKIESLEAVYQRTLLQIEARAKYWVDPFNRFDLTPTKEEA